MSTLHATPPGLPESNRSEWIIGLHMAFAIPATLGLLMVIFLAVPAAMPREFGLNLGSSFSSFNIFTSLVPGRWNITISVKNPNKLIAKYARMKLLLSFKGQLTLSRPSLVLPFTQGASNVTPVEAEALPMLSIVFDMGVKGLVSTLKGGEVTINVGVKAKRRVHLSPRWAAVFNAYALCMGVTFTSPTDGEGGGDWIILGSSMTYDFTN